MSAQGKLSPRNTRRLIRKYGLEAHPIVDAIATHDSWVVFRTQDRWHINVHRKTGTITQDPCREPNKNHGAACWNTCADLPNAQPL